MVYKFISEAWRYLFGTEVREYEIELSRISSSPCHDPVLGRGESSARGPCPCSVYRAHSDQFVDGGDRFFFVHPSHVPELTDGCEATLVESENRILGKEHKIRVPGAEMDAFELVA